MECTQPTHGSHRCTNPIPGHKVHACWPCDDMATWNDQGLTYREWLEAGRPPHAAETVAP